MVVSTPDTADGRQRDRSAGVQKGRGRERQRTPDVRAARGKAVGFRDQHADNRPPHGAELQRTAYHGWVAAEVRLPESVPEHHAFRAAELVLFRQQQPSEMRADAERRHHIRGCSHDGCRKRRGTGRKPYGSRLDIVEAEPFETRG